MNDENDDDADDGYYWLLVLAFHSLEFNYLLVGCQQC